jgi:3-deoxy-manno-octulosonate cytidylyltransferase (CMP-KDO synthetase)
MTEQVLAVIPARLGSSRFPGKVLYPYRGHPLLYYVWRAATSARSVDRVLIATDSDQIAESASAFGAEVFRSKKKHLSGSDRVAEAAKRSSSSIIVNIQADNLGLSGKTLSKVIRAMKLERGIRFATLASPIVNDAELFNPNAVKLVTAADRYALWFSRYPIPFLQHSRPGARSGQHPFLKHVGVYFFRAAALKSFAAWKPTSAERAESLEQLRILEHGGRMKVYVEKFRSISVDRPQDIKQLDRVKL